MPTSESIEAARREVEWLARQPVGAPPEHEVVAAALPVQPPIVFAPPDPAARRASLRRRRVLLVLGVVSMLSWAVPMSILTMDVLLAPLPRFEAPGGVTERLESRERRRILIQTRGGRHGDIDADSVSGADLGCTVREAASGTPVRLEGDTGFGMSINEDFFSSKLAFRAGRAGRYRIECAPRRGTGPLTLALGTGADLRRYFAILSAGVLLWVGLGAVGTFIIARGDRAGRDGNRRGGSG